MARRNSRFVNQKVIIGNKSIQEGDLTDSARDALGADSDFVKTVKNISGANITTSSIPPSAIADQNELITSVGALTTGGILTISRDAGNSFMNFASNQFSGTDPDFSVTPTPTGYEFFVKYTGSTLPITTPSNPSGNTGRLTVNLNTPVQNQQDLLHFFSVNAGADDDYIHSVQIFDEAPSNNYDYALNDDQGNLQYLTLLDSIPYGDPRLAQNGIGNNRVDIINSQRLWEGIPGAKLANGEPDFGNANQFTGVRYRNTYSRLRFRTRKSVPALETGGAPASYQLNAPEGPFGQGVSSPVWSRVSDRFVYKVVGSTQAQGDTSGYNSGGLGNPNFTVHSTIYKWPFASDSYTISSSGNSMITARISHAGQSSSTYGYNTGGGDPGNPVNSPLYYQRVIDRFPFNAPGTATSVGNIAPAPYNGFFGVGHSGPDYGFISEAGDRYGTLFRISRFPFSSPFNITTSINNLSEYRANAMGQSSSTHGYVSGGTGPATPVGPTGPLSSVSTILKFPFNAPGNTTSIGNLTAARISGSGQNSSTHGYTSGGSTIDKFPFNAPGNATSVGNLTWSNSLSSGVSSTGSGYSVGGTPYVSWQRIDRFPFAAPGNAIVSGNFSLPQARNRAAGQQV